MRNHNPKKTAVRAALARLPSVETILHDPRIAHYERNFSHEYISYITRRHVERARKDLKNGIYPDTVSRAELTGRIIENIVEYFAEEAEGFLMPAINATGVILHTGLGRAPLSTQAVKHVQKIIKGYSTLEIQRESGRRGKREQQLEEIFCFLTGAEAGTVVNNNAAAVLLTLNTLARGKEVLISRGELIEIGGSFRMPEIMEASSARMIEVGTTNKTKLSDYEKAISRKTGAILKVHSSNFKVLGFSESVPLAHLYELGKSRNIPVIYDLGSGALYDLRSLGLPYEPVVSESIKIGADVVTFSGDKVMGGPQAGIIAGKRKYLDKIKKNPIARTVRCDKLILAALEGTMLSYINGIKGFKTLPTTKMLTESPEMVQKRAQEVLSQLKNIPKRRIKITVEKSEAEAGSGALPLEKLPSYAVTIQSNTIKPEKIAKMLRLHTPPIFGYIKNDKVYLDMRTVFKNQINDIVEGIEFIRSQSKTGNEVG